MASVDFEVGRPASSGVQADLPMMQAEITVSPFQRFACYLGRIVLYPLSALVALVALRSTEAGTHAHEMAISVLELKISLFELIFDSGVKVNSGQSPVDSLQSLQKSESTDRPALIGLQRKEAAAEEEKSDAARLANLAARKTVDAKCEKIERELDAGRRKLEQMAQELQSSTAQRIARDEAASSLSRAKAELDKCVTRARCAGMDTIEAQSLLASCELALFSTETTQRLTCELETEAERLQQRITVAEGEKMPGACKENNAAREELRRAIAAALDRDVCATAAQEAFEATLGEGVTLGDVMNNTVQIRGETGRLQQQIDAKKEHEDTGVRVEHAHTYLREAINDANERGMDTTHAQELLNQPIPENPTLEDLQTHTRLLDVEIEKLRSAVRSASEEKAREELHVARDENGKVRIEAEKLIRQANHLKTYTWLAMQMTDEPLRQDASLFDIRKNTIKFKAEIERLKSDIATAEQKEAERAQKALDVAKEENAAARQKLMEDERFKAIGADSSEYLKELKECAEVILHREINREDIQCFGMDTSHISKIMFLLERSEAEDERALGALSGLLCDDGYLKRPGEE